MEFHGIWWWFDGISWDFMVVFNGILLDLMVVYYDLMEFNGGFMGFYGIMLLPWILW